MCTTTKKSVRVVECVPQPRYRYVRGLRYEAKISVRGVETVPVDDLPVRAGSGVYWSY
jgi:hypothetical protein